MGTEIGQISAVFGRIITNKVPFWPESNPLQGGEGLVAIAGVASDLFDEDRFSGGPRHAPERPRGASQARPRGAVGQGEDGATI